MATLLAHTVFTGGANGGTSSGIDTTGATLIVIVASFDPHGTAITVSDSKGNGAPTAKTAANVDGDAAIQIHFWDTPSSTGTGHTFTVSGTGCGSSFEVMAWDGTPASCFDTTATPATIDTGAFGLTVGPMTPNFNNELIISGCTVWVGNAATVGGASGFTVSDSANGNRPTNTIISSSAAYQLQGGATAVSLSWVTQFEFRIAAVMACFKTTPSAHPFVQIIKV